MSSFRFKQFEVDQSHSAMKVGSDGVLLGAWCSVSSPTLCEDCLVQVASSIRVLDVGTGTGLIALMVAQRSSVVQIDAIDIDPGSCRDAAHNFAKSPWGSRLRVHHTSLQDFTQTIDRGFQPDIEVDDMTSQVDLYDRIISNPPYFIDSLKSPSSLRNSARHTDTLSYHDLICCSLNMLTDCGSLAVILPLNESVIFERLALEMGLYCCRRLDVHSTPTSGVRRVAMEFYRACCECECITLIIENGLRHDYSDDYKSLTKDFYLKF